MRMMPTDHMIDQMQRAITNWKQRFTELERQNIALQTRAERAEKALDELWNAGYLRTYFQKEADAQNPDARYVEFSFDNSVMDVETFLKIWQERERAA